MLDINKLCKSSNVQEFLSLEKVSEILNVSQDILLLWQSEKKGPTWYNFHGVPRYLADDVQNFIKSSLQLVLPMPFWARDLKPQDYDVQIDNSYLSEVPNESENI